VHQVLVNYQMRRQGGQGYLRLMRFVPRENKVYCKSYSPVLDRYKEDPENQFALQYDMRLPTDAGAAVGTSTKEPKPKEMLVDVRKIWDKAPHNAFTDLVRFKGKWFCVFREGEGHVSLDGKIRVITSTDGTDWTSAALIASSDPKLPDMRDAKLSVTPDGRLMLVTAASTRWYVGKERQHHYRTYATFSDDGSTWEKLVQIGDENFWLWRVTWHKGTAFTNGYTVTGPRFLRLYTSADGRDFKPLVAKHTVRGYIGEDTILFTEDGTAYCLLRSAEPGWLGRAKSPYTEWTWKQLNVQIGGPHMVQLPDGRFLAAGRKYHKTKPVRYTTVLWWVDVDKGRLTEFLELPSGGDTSYPGLVPHDGLLWVSYYSSHERNKACIYLAKVKLPPKT